MFIPDPDADFLPSRILDPGVKKAPNPGSRIRIRNTDKGNHKTFIFPQILQAYAAETTKHQKHTGKQKPVLRIRIRDPGLGAFLTPGSGIRDGRKSASGSGIRDEQPGSYFLELRNHFFAFLGVKILKFFDEDLGSGIRDGDSSDPGSGMEKSRIRDPG